MTIQADDLTTLRDLDADLDDALSSIAPIEVARTRPVLADGEAPGTWAEYEPKLQRAVLDDALALLDAEVRRADAEKQRADSAEYEVARLKAMLAHPSRQSRRPHRDVVGSDA